MSSGAERSDRAARVRALDTECSFIIQAPAGSGKTELLIQRYLALLARVDQPEEVVAVTFTRKAAGEMRNRIVDALTASRTGVAARTEHEWITQQLAAAALRRDAQRAWGLADNPGRMRIRTIDSLSRSLTSQMPLLSGLGPVPEPQDDATDLYREAARETLAQLEDPQWSDQVAALLMHLNNDTARAEQLLAGLLARRDQWLRHQQRFDRAALTEALANLVRERLQRARDELANDAVPELLVCVANAAARLYATAAPALREIADSLRMPAPAPERLEAWQAIADFLLTADGDLRKKVDKRHGFPAAGESGISAEERARRQEAKDCMDALLAKLTQTPQLVAALVEVRRLPPPHYTDEQWRLIEALSPMLRLALAQLEIIFRARGVVDFPQLLIGANRALGEPEAPTDLALILDYRISHLLVDEFQDTSLSQYDLLQRLTLGWQPGDGRTLFVVGDPMQSIYRFREAEVALFLRARNDGIGAVVLEALTLTRNFRSQAGLVEWVNRIFSAVLPRHEDMATGAIPYSASLPTKPALAGDAVQIHVLNSRSAEAARVIELVRTAQAEHSDQRIAILVRSRMHLHDIVPALKQARLRFRAIEIEVLAHRPAVQDVYALTRALLHPADRVAWLSVLRAPWCGLTLTDLERLVGDQRDGILWVRMTDENVVATLSSDGQARLRRLLDALSPARGRRARDDLRIRVEGAWINLGGPACVQEPTDLEDVQVYLDLLAALEQGGDLEDLQALEAKLDKLYALADLQAPETLQLMTIHKAKGLEFDTVLVPGLSAATGVDDTQLLRWIERPRADGGSDLLLGAMTASGGADDAIYASITRLSNERQEHEDGRVLYVAATRAVNRLHLLAQPKAIEGPDGKLRADVPTKGALLAKLWPVIEAEVQRAVAAGALNAGAHSALVNDPMRYPLRRLALSWTPPSPPQPVAWQQVQQEDTTREAVVEFSWVGESARHIGTVVHLFLQRMAQVGVEAWDTGHMARIDPVLRNALKQEGVPASELDAAHQRVRSALSGVRGDRRARWLLSAEHLDANSEYRLAGELDGAFVNVVFDRTFVDDGGVRWIVDYKTGMHEGGDVEAFLDSERERYRSQLERYARLLSRSEKRPICLGLYFPLLKGWREWPAEG
ncbi:MAG: UvrD-helicase domain-containing protein [Betaproteobacteria bacterium]